MHETAGLSFAERTTTMRSILPVLLICLGHFGQAQVKLDEKPRKWMIGAGFSPDIAYRYLQAGEYRSSTSIAKRNAVEHPRMAFTTGLYANYFFNERIGIGTGLTYSLKGYEISRHRVETRDHAKSQGPFLPFYYSAMYGTGYLDIPVTGFFIIGKGRLRSITSLGVAGNFGFLHMNRYELEYDDGQVHRSNDRRSIQFQSPELSGMFGTGVSYRMNNALELRLEPNLRHAILTPGARGYTKTLLWNAGLNISAFWVL
jgi:hypothetical protein